MTTRWVFVMSVMGALVACSSKDQAKTEASNSAAASAPAGPAATGVKGKIRGKPFEAKSAWVQPGASTNGDPVLYLLPVDATCSIKDLNGNPPKDTAQATVIAPLKTGVTKFDNDKVFASFVWWSSPTQVASFTCGQGEIEYLQVPTETTKGVVRVKFSQDPDVAVEGSIEVKVCKDPK